MRKLTATEIGTILGLIIGAILFVILYLTRYNSLVYCLFSLGSGNYETGAVCVPYIVLIPIATTILGILIGFIIRKVKQKKQEQKQDKAYFDSYESQ